MDISPADQLALKTAGQDRFDNTRKASQQQADLLDAGNKMNKTSFQKQGFAASAGMPIWRYSGTATCSNCVV
jgi:hypothetical protein